MNPPVGTRIGINGFGRIGRLALRAAWDWPELEFMLVNELKGDAHSSAHLLTFDSVHGRWPRDVAGSDEALTIDGARIGHSRHASPEDVPWDEAGVDVVLECSGKYRTPESLAPYSIGACAR